jgi:hypothetical protein
VFGGVERTELCLKYRKLFTDFATQLTTWHLEALMLSNRHTARNQNPLKSKFLIMRDQYVNGHFHHVHF